MAADTPTAAGSATEPPESDTPPPTPSAERPGASPRPRTAQRPRRPRTLPFQQGDIAPGHVTRLATRGGAEAEVSGVTVRAPGGVPGDRGLFRVTHVGRNSVYARLHELHEPGPGRVEPDCDVVHRCGGCPWQMASVATQREARQGALEAALAGATDAATRWLDWEESQERYGYRTRALMMARHLKGELRLGFYAADSTDLVPAEGCAVQHPQANITLDAAQGVLARHGLSTWRSPTRPGILRALLLRVDPGQRGGLLTLVVSRPPDEQLRRVSRELLSLDGVVGVYANVNTSEGGPVLGPDDVHLAGMLRQKVRFGDLELEVGPTAFLQTQHGMAQRLVLRVGELVPEAIGHLLDAYAGLGVLGLSLRDRAQRVTLVESAPAAVIDARHNIERLGAHNVHMTPGDAALTAPPIIAGEDPPDVILLDPPRAGCATEVLEAVVAAPHDPRVVLISCGLKGLARDVRQLVAGGYRVTEVSPLEMFPHTPHVEVVVGLRRGQ